MNIYCNKDSLNICREETFKLKQIVYLFIFFVVSAMSNLLPSSSLLHDAYQLTHASSIVQLFHCLFINLLVM